MYYIFSELMFTIVHYLSVAEDFTNY